MMQIQKKRQVSLLILAVIAAYGNTVMNGFAFDDARAVVYNSDIRSWGNFFDIILSTRGVRLFTYMLDYSLFGLSPAGYHIHNILWQIVAVLLAYRLLLRLVVDERAAIIAALVFALHPIHVEAVANISNRKEMICFVFFLYSLLSYINIFSTVDYRKKIKWGGLSALFFLLAFRSKEIAIMIPAMFVLYELLFVKKDNRIIIHARFVWFKIALFLLALLLSVSKFSGYILLNRSTYYSHYRLSGDFMEYTHILNNVFIVFVYYIRNFFFPVNLLPDYFIPAQGSIFNLAFAFSFSCLLFYFYMIYLSYSRNRAICFGLLWFLVNFIIISPLNLPIYPLCDRYLYLPSLGLCLVSGIVISNWMTAADLKVKPAIRRTVLALICFCLALLSINYNSYWKNDSALWSHALKKNPESRVGRINLAKEYGKLGRFTEAEAQIRKMGDMDPRDLVTKHTNMMLSEIYYRRNNKEKAFEMYRAIVAKVDHLNLNITYPYIMKFASFFKESGLFPEALESYNILKKANYRLDIVSSEVMQLERILEDKKGQEIEVLKSAIESNPGDGGLLLDLGIIYYNIRSYDKAEKTFMEALKIDNNLFGVHYNLGLVYQQTERFEEAAREFEKAISSVAAVSPNVHNNLGQAYMRLHRDKDAIEQFLRAINLQKDFAASYINLGNAYSRMGNDMKAIDAYRAFLKYWDGEEFYRRLVESKLSDLLSRGAKP